MHYVLTVDVILGDGHTFSVRTSELARGDLFHMLRTDPGDEMRRFHVFRIADEIEAGYWSGSFSLLEPASIVTWRLRPVRGAGRVR